MTAPRLPGTYPPVPYPATIGKNYRQRGNRGRLSGWGRVIVAERGEGEYHARASNEYMADGWGDRAGLWNSRGL